MTLLTDIKAIGERLKADMPASADPSYAYGAKRAIDAFTAEIGECLGEGEGQPVRITKETFEHLREMTCDLLEAGADDVEITTAFMEFYASSGSMPEPQHPTLAAHGEKMGEGWQPIETAPRDGPPILLGREGCPPVIGWWINDEVGWAKASYMHGRYDGFMGGRANIPQPTHWMPLPPAPELVKGKRLPDHPAMQAVTCEGCGAPSGVHYNNCQELVKGEK